MKYISNITHMSKKDQTVIRERLKVIEFFEEFGKIEKSKKNRYKKWGTALGAPETDYLKSGLFLIQSSTPAVKADSQTSGPPCSSTK